MTTEETITELNGLIHNCKDGELGYTTAAADVTRYRTRDRLHRVRGTAPPVRSESASRG